jgi:hypothetical protein
MEIKEKYRSYGSSSHAESPSFKATLLTIAAIAAVGLLFFVFVTVHPVHDVGSLLLLLMLFVAAICFFVNYVSRAKDSGFVADDASVTFTRKFAKDIIIPYIDIDTIAVYTERKSGGKGGSFYVETLLITTLDGQDYEFKAVMDIKPNGRLEATGFMDKMLEMGKFKALQRYIEQKKQK